MRPVFRDPVYQEHFDRFGWVKVAFLSADDLSEIDRLTREKVSTCSDGLSITFVMSDEIKAATADIIKSVFRPRITELVHDYRLITTSLINKSGKGKGEVKLHQHFCIMDETIGLPNLNIWCPLVDTDSSNGNLKVVSGTHRIPRFARPHSSDPFPYYSLSCWQLFEQCAEAVPAKAGEAIVFDNSLIHGSPPSLIDDNRTVALAGIIPKEADTIMYFAEDDGRLSIRTVNEKYLMGDPMYGAKPATILGYTDMPSIHELEQKVFEILGVAPPSARLQE